jgi:hypothetical protein
MDMMTNKNLRSLKTQYAAESENKAGRKAMVILGRTDTGKKVLRKLEKLPRASAKKKKTAATPIGCWGHSEKYRSLRLAFLLHRSTALYFRVTVSTTIDF